VFDSVPASSPSPKRCGARPQVPRPRICFVNKMDRIGADFKRTFDQIISKLEANRSRFSSPLALKITSSRDRPHQD